MEFNTSITPSFRNIIIPQILAALFRVDEIGYRNVETNVSIPTLIILSYNY